MRIRNKNAYPAWEDRLSSPGTGGEKTQNWLTLTCPQCGTQTRVPANWPDDTAAYCGWCRKALYKRPQIV